MAHFKVLVGPPSVVDHHFLLVVRSVDSEGFVTGGACVRRFVFSFSFFLAAERLSDTILGRVLRFGFGHKIETPSSSGSDVSGETDWECKGDLVITYTTVIKWSKCEPSKLRAIRSGGEHS